MSSFKDTFTREDGSEKNLQYDDAAFYYFFSSILLVIIIPIIYSIIKHVFKRKPYLNPNANKDYQQCKLDLNKYIKEKEQYSWVNSALFFKLFVLIVALLIYQQVVTKIGNQSQELKGFDPYEILEIPREATEQEVKRAYRRLGVLYHPDKNPDDPEAAAKFMLITKAYECLTDENAKVNCEKFGNPDGPGTFSVAIALPSALLKKENHVLVLSIFFLVILIIIPSIVMYWYTESSKYDVDGILLDDKRLFYQLLNENLTIKQLPKVLGCCLEFKPILGVTQSQKRDMEALHKKIVEELEAKPQIDVRFFKTHDLIHAWMMNVSVGKTLESDLYLILNHAPALLESMINFALSFPKIRGYKVFGLRCVNAIIEFSQCFFQGLWVNDHPYSQLSIFNKERIAKLTKGKKTLPSLLSIIKQTEEERMNIGNFITEEERPKFLQEIANLPKINITKNVYVENENEIMVGDIITIKVELRRENTNVKNYEYVKSYRYPALKKEKWYIIVADPNLNLIIFQKQVNDLKDLHEEKFKFPADIERELTWMLYVKSDCYKDLDQEFELKFKILPKQNREKLTYHPEDEALDRQPSLYQQMISSMFNKENDSDEELEEDENNKNKDKKDEDADEEELEDNNEKRIRNDDSNAIIKTETDTKKNK